MILKFFKRIKIPVFIFLTCCFAAAFVPPVAEGAARGVFLAKLFDARGLAQDEAGEGDGAAFLLRTGLVTDSVTNLKAPVTRREALRWCIQSLGLAFEAEIFSGLPGISFKDVSALTAFERGCLAVAVTMKPPLLARSERFNGSQPLADKDMDALLQRVRQASRGLSLNATLTPLNGLTLQIHRDGVFTGIPKWRVYADGFEDKNSAEAAQKFFKSQGFDMTPRQPLYEWFLRTQLMDDYPSVTRLMNLIKKRGLTAYALPSLTNPNTAILPRYWVMLTIDPTFWKMAPIASQEGPRSLAPLTQMVRANNVKAALNAGFFAVTGKRRGYPIGILRVEGELMKLPYEGRSCLGWNDDDEAMFGFVSQIGGILTGANGESWEEMTSIIQAGPLLLDEGQPQANTEGFNNSLISMRHPRSVVGLTAEGEWFFLAVDGRNGLHASGATLSELTEILRSYRVPYALNLDGGGSTEIIVNGKIYNFPSGGKERSISYALGIRPVN